MAHSVRRFALAFSVSLLAGSLAAANFTVTNTADSGAGSLRQALIDASAAGGGTVVFNIPGAGVKTIRPLIGLSASNTVVDGTTQPGYAGTPLIEIDGSLLPSLTAGLTIGPGTVKALVVNRCSYVGIRLAGNSIVQGSFLGTDATGQTALGNGSGIYTDFGIYQIGGPGPGEGNVISGNVYGIYYQGRGGQIAGNRIGTNSTGTAAIPNLDDGIFADNADAVTIGGPGPAEGNLISGNHQYGINIFYSNNVVVSNNVIGPDVNGGATLPTQRAGIIVYQSSGARIGGPGLGNVVTQSWEVAIGVEATSVRNTISRNSLYGNAFGIDLDYSSIHAGFVTPNDPCDADSGPNLLQNFPVITSGIASGGSVSVQGFLESEPSQDFGLEFFASPGANSSGYGEGKTYLGSLLVTTGSNCMATFQGSFAANLPPGSVVTATATDSFGDTSEFSRAVAVAVPVPTNFYSLTPCRVLDTRNSPGPLGGPALAAGTTRTFIAVGACSIPADARALSANVTVTQPSAAGFLIVYPAGTPAPFASTINYRAGQTRANNALVLLGAGGDLAVLCGQATGTTHVVLDVNGYFR